PSTSAGSRQPECSRAALSPPGGRFHHWLPPQARGFFRPSSERCPSVLLQTSLTPILLVVMGSGVYRRRKQTPRGAGTKCQMLRPFSLFLDELASHVVNFCSHAARIIRKLRGLLSARAGLLVLHAVAVS